ncbi:DUF3006 domain-containing protein (plasmid) [Clostridium estertheticum]|uniref:DUF3006 domain-containing protein n=1 Tax=Clostridium estertheticum TaxID=238834 RepID=A0AA47ENA9_9CLOT|nr:DUF3006 domain-containing protein [Clostridium estertheticum]MBU3158088.1 DUF3006 domain-containing protein [Clostridium estertheticum]MBU3201997.1 DUF3006 domain-containing protein [Clostridium estertheticum]WAG63327.1 DUF3006 domain-containing protein [Clostridium estertheticum]WAG68232.1 DUF3006 domain-containing protein [Clostridium estertheticum]
MKVIINRFEGSYAVCEKEDKTMMDINSIDLPFEAKEGDVLVLDNNIITIDVEETKKRHRDIQILTDDLWE